MRKSDFTLPTLDDLFSTQAERDDAKLERVRNIPLAELHPFKGHPFKVQNNEEMQRMIESIRKVGAITPALARPQPDGGYELISGHRRLAACQVLGVETMPVIVRELSDDEAVIAMVDAGGCQLAAGDHPAQRKGIRLQDEKGCAESSGYDFSPSWGEVADGRKSWFRWWRQPQSGVALYPPDLPDP